MRFITRESREEESKHLLVTVVTEPAVRHGGFAEYIVATIACRFKWWPNQGECMERISRRYREGLD